MIVHNAAPARDPDGPALDDLVDVLVVNRVEAGMFAGRPVDDAADAMAVLPALGAERRSVIVTLGAGGLVGSGPGEDAFALPGHDVDAVNSHGAGDCFIGALASRLAAGEPLEAACQFANAAAGLFVAADAAEREALDAASVDDFLGGLRP